MAGTGQSYSMNDVWELHKAEIGWLYERMTLKAVKEHMEREEQFPVYSLSTWKKKVVRWRFDNKYNKRTAIEEAAAHFQQVSRDERCTAFTPKSGKPVTEQELQRYLQRRRMIVNNGRILPENISGASCTTITVPQAPLIDGEAASVLYPNDETEEAVEELTLEQRQPPPQARRPSRSQARKAWQYRRTLCKIKTHYLFGQRTIRASDLAMPDTVRHHYAVLKGITDSIQSSWAANLWWVTSAGYMCGYVGNNVVELNLFSFRFREAAARYSEGSFSQARISMLKAAEYLRLAIDSLVTDSLEHFLLEFSIAFERYGGNVTTALIKAIASFFSHDDCLYPGIQNLFRSFQSIPSESLGYVLQQAREAWAKSLSTIEDTPTWSATLELKQIVHSASLTDEECGDRLLSRGERLCLEPSIRYPIVQEFFCQAVNSYLCAEKLATAEYVLDRVFQLMREQPHYRENIFQIQLFFQCLRGQVYLRQHRPQDAISELHLASSLERKMPSLYLDSGIFAFLSQAYRLLDEEEAALVAENQQKQLIDQMEALCLNDLSTHQEVITPNLDQSDNDDEEGWSHSEKNDVDDVQEVEKMWQNYVDGKAYDMKNAVSTTFEWRQDIDASTRDQLMLSKPLFEDEMDLCAMDVLMHGLS